jgi:uncharacterized protein
MRKRSVFFLSMSAMAASFLAFAAARPAIRAEIIKPVPITAVTIADPFWTPRIDVNRTKTLPYLYKKFSEGGRTEPKTLEATFFTLAQGPDPALQKLADEWIAKIVSPPPSGKPERSRSGIELGSGHFYEAASTQFELTGKRDLLNKAIESADTVASLFGPDKRRDVPGHQGIEEGLVRLSLATGNDQYWKLAKFLLDERGHSHEFFGRKMYGFYAQDQAPVTEQSEAVGHAVRALFMYMGMSDVAAIDGDAGYRRALGRIWEDITYRKMTLTGGLGPRRQWEGFGEPYELNNLTPWNETCAAFSNAEWNYRLFQEEADAKYIDIFERTLYNGFLVGVSLSGEKFFYQNLLKSVGGFERSDWFGVPCCPPNVARLLASLGGFVYARSGDRLFVNLFVGGRAKIDLDHNSVSVRQETKYPWDGAVKIAVDPEKTGPFTLSVRIPGFARNEPVPGDLYHYADPAAAKPVLKVNGKPVEIVLEKGFARIERTWAKGDVVELALPMPVRRVLANDKARIDAGLVALERGPIVYCAEWPDNAGQVLNLVVPDAAKLQGAYRPDLLGGMGVVTGNVVALARAADGVSLERKGHALVAIPYFAWANRGPGPMNVWLAREEGRAAVAPAKSLASLSRISVSPNRGAAQAGSTASTVGDPAVVADQAVPMDSFDGDSGFYRMIPVEGKTSWIQYDFAAPAEVGSAEVYFYDDHRFCRLPESWRILYNDNGTWKPVANRGPYPVAMSAFNAVSFAPVKTTGLRLEIQGRKQIYFDGVIGPPTGNFISNGPVEWYEFGVLEWRVK